jgi:PAS domain-containing protein
MKTGYYDVLYTQCMIPRPDRGLLALTQEVTALVKAHQEVAQERARLDAILQALPVGIWITDPSGRIIQKNRKGDEIWAGDTPLSEDITAYLEYSAFKPGSNEPLTIEERPMVRALMKGETTSNLEFDIQRLDGTRGTILAGAAPVRLARRVDRVGLSGAGYQRSQTIPACLTGERSPFHALADHIPSLAWIADAGKNLVQPALE